MNYCHGSQPNLCHNFYEGVRDSCHAWRGSVRIPKDSEEWKSKRRLGYNKHSISPELSVSAHPITIQFNSDRCRYGETDVAPGSQTLVTRGYVRAMVAAGLILILKDGKPRQEIDLESCQSLSMGK